MISSRAWRDAEPEQFEAAILVAAEQLDVLPLAVEKDYWVCEALRAIVATHPGEVIFKGGTSLEKLRIIKRFSEDLDLLVVGRYGSTRKVKDALKAMIATAAGAVNAAPGTAKQGGKMGSFSRSAYIEPMLNHSADQGAVAHASAVLVELGQSGGPNPHSQHSVISLLARQLDAAGFDTSAWTDLAAFDVNILHPGRTLIEKLLRVNNFASDEKRQESTHGWPRIGRQFYDLWALLHDPRVLDFLAVKAATAMVLEDCFEVLRSFTPDLPVPEGGFAASPAFDPEGPLADRLRAEHEAAMRDLYYGTDEPPTFDEVLAAIAEHRELLDFA